MKQNTMLIGAFVAGLATTYALQKTKVFGSETFASEYSDGHCNNGEYNTIPNPMPTCEGTKFAEIKFVNNFKISVIVRRYYYDAYGRRNIQYPHNAAIVVAEADGDTVEGAIQNAMNEALAWSNLVRDFTGLYCLSKEIAPVPCPTCADPEPCPACPPTPTCADPEPCPEPEPCPRCIDCSKQSSRPPIDRKPTRGFMGRFFGGRR